MPKRKFALSKKHEKLIDILVNIPTVEDMRTGAYFTTVPIAHDENAIDSLILALKTISKDTAYQDVCEDIIERANAAFQYCKDKNKRYLVPGKEEDEDEQ